MKELKTNPIFQKIWSKYGYNLLIILGVIGIVLLSVDSLPSKKNSEKAPQAKMTAENFRISLEEQLTDILSHVSGAGNVKIMITLEAGEENVYVRQEKTTGDLQTVFADRSDHKTERSTYENEIVMVNDGVYKGALVEKTLYPAVQGVIVVCDGADDIQVVSDITNAVSVVLNIPSNRVCVIKKK